MGKPYDEWLSEKLYQNQINADSIVRIGSSNMYRRAGMPLGDDVLVSHVDTEWVKKRLDRRKEIDAKNIKRPPRDPLVQRTSSKPLAELKAIFNNTNNSNNHGQTNKDSGVDGQNKQ